MNAIYKFVMSMLAKRGGKTGLPTIQKGKGLNVELSVKQIEQTLKNMGVDISKITSPKEVQKYLNIQDSLLKQKTVKKPPKDILKTTKKKEEPFTGWTPKVVERSMPADDYAGLKEEWFSRIMTNTDEALNTWLKKGDWTKSDEIFINLSSAASIPFFKKVFKASSVLVIILLNHSSFKAA